MKILVISLAGIGDTLFATPLIHELRANFPGATIDALVRWPRLEGFARRQSASQRDPPKKLHFRIQDRLAPIPVEVPRANAMTCPSTRIRKARRLYRLVAKFINAPARLGHEYECFSTFDRCLTNRTIPQDYTRHRC